MSTLERPAPSTTTPTYAGTPTAATTHLDGLDGLRALAIGAVLVYHLDPSWLPGGFLGVDVFFVVSGFLITTLLQREALAHGRIALRPVLDPASPAADPRPRRLRRGEHRRRAGRPTTTWSSTSGGRSSAP